MCLLQINLMFTYISVNTQTTLNEARRLIPAVPASPSFYHFVSSATNTPISRYMEHLQPASQYAPMLILRPVEEEDQNVAVELDRIETWK